MSEDEALKGMKQFWRDAKPLIDQLGAPPAGSKRRDSDARWADSRIKEADGSDPRRQLSRDQLSVVVRIAAGESVAEAAARSGVHPERIRRWIATPRFQRAVLKQTAAPMTLSQRFGNWDEEENHAE
jgi:hypothetical protein